MIPLSRLDVQNKSWQQQLAQAVTDPRELCEILELPEPIAEDIQTACENFSLKVTRDFLECINKGDINDPLLRQVLPVRQELDIQPGFVSDPVGDLDASAVPGLLHKYHGRALLITTPACAINCRYCFRRHFPYSDASAHGAQLDQAIDYISRHAEISEVILSGGDPLAHSDNQLAELIRKLEDISHVTTLRIHSRLPIVLPARITSQLLNLLETTRLQSVLVVHCNHPSELSEKVINALGLAASRPITLLNQSVLLAGVNDDADTLTALGQKLFSAGVLPYYLHMLDPVAGAAHFFVNTEKALVIHDKIKQRLPGYLVPKLVREIPKQPYKNSVGKL